MVSVYKFLYFTGVISHLFSHHQNNLPFISTARQGTQNASVSISEVHSIPHSGGNFPKDVIPFPLFLSLSNTHIQKRTHSTCMHACMLMFFIYLCAEQTPRCVSLVSCVTMMKGTCCSQQKPLSTLRYRHPACIIHKSSGNSVTAHSLNFCDMGWRETQDSSVDPCPYVTFSRRENGAIMLMTSSSLCITFILPMRSENTFQTA